MHSQKLHRFEVDQSVRIEETNRDTTVAIANAEKSFAIKLPRRTKRQVFEYFRRIGTPKQFAPRIFAASIIVLLQKSKFHTQDIVIDIEYPGYEKEILFWITKVFPNISVYFTEIGKKSSAHYAAYGVFIKKRKADYVVSARELLHLL